MMKLWLMVIFAWCAVTVPAQAGQRYTACAKIKNFTTPVAINLETPPPFIDQRLTRAQLNQGQDAVHEDWLKRNAMQTVWSVQEMQTLGQAAGGWGMMSVIRSLAKPFDQFGSSYCPYFGTVELNMMYRTIISIPKEFKPGSCAYNVILEHEMRHHATNVKTVNEIIARLRQDLHTVITEVETSGSYVSRPQVDPRFKYMQSSLESAVTIYLNDTMQKTMNSRNQLIDSPAEYERADAAIKKCAE